METPVLYRTVQVLLGVGTGTERQFLLSEKRLSLSLSLEYKQWPSECNLSLRILPVHRKRAVLIAHC